MMRTDQTLAMLLTHLTFTHFLVFVGAAALLAGATAVFASRWPGAIRPERAWSIVFFGLAYLMMGLVIGWESARGWKLLLGGVALLSILASTVLSFRALLSERRQRQR